MQVFGMPSYYFNPRSYKRSDGFRVYGIPCTFKFQSTLLQEERRVSSIFTISCLYISIHAPTRGATRFRFRDNISTFYFNPRSYKRSDFLVDAASAIAVQFQSTLLQEERLCICSFFLFTEISIHAPTRGATCLRDTKRPAGTISIHAPTRGATPGD